MSDLIPDDGPTTAANAELSGLYWQVGQRIHREILGSRHAGYGDEIVSTLSRQLTSDHLTVLPSREAVQAKLHQSVEKARLRLLDEKGRE